jgi:hypothetical protein
MSAPVGADIESICNKCGDVWHVVVAKVGEVIAKVQCKECHGLHRYKNPKAPAKKKAAAKPRSRATASASAAAVAEVVAPDLSRPPRAYRTGEIFEPGDRVEHPTFGTGVVQSSPGPGKVAIMFADGPRLLAQAKPASQLSRGTRRSAVADADS